MNGSYMILSDEVAPLAGAWIEISGEMTDRMYRASLPSRERGLKFLTRIILRHAGRRSPRGSVD